jgi:hypothetical protein
MKEAQTSAEGKQLFFEFVQTYLGVPGLVGIQSGFGEHPDQILFTGPHHETLAVPVAILFEESREEARAFIVEKMTKSDARFSLRMCLAMDEPKWREIEIVEEDKC